MMKNSNYKDITKIAHKVLADRINIRNNANVYANGDRIPYIYIKNDSAKLQGDRIELPDYIKENNIQIDYLHYITNKIMKPILQLYALCIDKIPNNNLTKDYWVNIDNKLKDKTIYQDDMKRAKRLEALKQKYIQDLLFKKYIDKLN